MILGILLLLFLLTLLPLRVAVAFREEFTVELGWLWFRFPLWPQEEQPSQEESPPEEGAPRSPWSKVRRGIEKVRALLRKRGLSGLLETLGELSRLLKDSAGKLGRRVRLREFDLYVCLGGEEDAALAAIQYGQVSGAVYAACGVILSLLPCKKAGVMSETFFPASLPLNTRKNTRRMSLVKSKSQWNTRVFMVPAELIKMSMAVRRLVCTNCTARTWAVSPLGVVATAAHRVAPASSRAARPSSCSGS